MTSRCILAIDQGTSSTKGVLFGLDANVHGVATVAVDLHSPKAGWVEQDPNQILESVLSAAGQLMPQAEVIGVALTNQRESALAWSSVTGEPLSAMLGWQDRRTAGRVNELSGKHQLVRELSGLPLDPMFSALKFEWILNQIDSDRSRSKAGEILLGTVDSWLTYKLTGQHVIEVGNASRTQLLNVATGEWAPELLELFNVETASLPTVVASNHVVEITLNGPLAGKQILATLADSHAALYAHYRTNGANVKATFGTGSSVMALSDQVAASDSGLVTTIAWGAGGKVTKALEGNILSAGSTLVWLADLLATSPQALADLAETKIGNHITDGQINLVPAFGGLGAPWWNIGAKALLDGMTLATDRGDLAVAAFEALCLQIEDVLQAVERVTGQQLESVNVDGGPTSNPWLMQLMANLSQRNIAAASISELSAVGTALFAIHSNQLTLTKDLKSSPATKPSVTEAETAKRQAAWNSAVNRSINQ